MIDKETLRKCGLKPSRRKTGINTWTRTVFQPLTGEIIFEYIPSSDEVNIITQEPAITHCDTSIKIKDEEDFLDISWEFFVKYEANYDHNFPIWDTMASVHHKPDSRSINEAILKNKEDREKRFAEYRERFKSDNSYSTFTKQASILEGKLVDCDKFFRDACIDILATAMSNGLTPFFELPRPEFDVRVMHHLLYKDKFSVEEIKEKIKNALRYEEHFFGDDDEQAAIERIGRVCNGFSVMPIQMVGIVYGIPDDKGNLHGEIERRCVSCHPYITELADGTKKLRGYYADLRDWFEEAYKKISGKPLYILFSHSIYSDYAIWKAGVECGLFDE